MIMVLGDNGANQLSPNPRGVRDHNSPIAPAMRRLRSHDAKCKLDPHRRQHAVAPPASAARRARIEGHAQLFARGELQQLKGAAMTKRIVVTTTEARQATKEGVVRYVLAISLALVVVLFVVAYLLFH
jgi:hypothetical protein